MTSSGPDHAPTGNTGTTGASASSAGSAGPTGSSTSRSSHRRRRHVHRRSAPPSARTLEATRSTGSATSSPQNTAASTRDNTTTSEDTAVPQSGTTQKSRRPTRLPKTFLGDLPDAQAAPFVSLTIAASGIHPSTSRLVAVAAVLYDAEGKPVTFTGNRPASSSAVSNDTPGTVELTGVVQQINPGEDPGPWHLHGYTEAELGQAPGFATVASLLFTLLNDRTVICHKTSLTWGFIVQEYRRAQRAAQRSASQSGNRGRRRNQRRPRKIAVPQPERIVEILGTSRRQSVPVIDPRLRSITGYYRDAEGLNLGADMLPDLGAVASEARADTNADELLLADARILMPLHLVQEDLADAGRGVIQSSLPEDLTADRFGLQRSSIRVDATTAPRPLANPGVPASTEVGTLTAGMEFVVSPDVATNPDELIAAGLRAGLVYSEKLNRTSSLVVCNQNHELRGKAMHAHRKNIPLFSDAEFLAALDDVAEGTASTGKPETRPATPRIPAPQRGGQSRSRQGGNRSGNKQNNKQDNSQGTKQGTRQSSKPSNKQGNKPNNKQGNKQGTKQGRNQASTQDTTHGASQLEVQSTSQSSGSTGAAEVTKQGDSSASTGSASRTGSSSNRNRSRNRNRRRPRNQQQNAHNQQGQPNRHNQQSQQGQQDHQSQPNQQEQPKKDASGNNSQRSHRSGARRRRRSGGNRRPQGNNNGNNGGNNSNTNQAQQKGD